VSKKSVRVSVKLHIGEGIEARKKRMGLANTEWRTWKWIGIVFAM